MFCTKCGKELPENGECSCVQEQQSQKQIPPTVQGFTEKIAQSGMVGDILSKSFLFLLKKPFQLWGLSLLYGIISMLASLLSGGLPIVGIAINLVLALGMTSIFLNGYRGNQVSSTQLFEGFNKKFFRNAGGMAWRSLWIFIWGLVPFVGFICAIVKSYSYRFVPYIMLNEPDIIATEALKKSMVQTNGYKGKMFLTDLLIGVAIFVVTLVLLILCLIPIVRGFFATILFLFILVAVLFLPLLKGIISAAFYEEITKRIAQNQLPNNF